MQDAVAYRPRYPESTILYSVVARNLETFLARQQERERPIPAFVEEEFRSYLKCGIAEFGFLRLHCDTCGKDRVLPFSCKNRGYCPACCGRRMTETAIHLVDRVIPKVPVRQWVFSLPYAFRYRVAFDAALFGEVLGIMIRTVFEFLKQRACDNGIPESKCGAVVCIQRFGSALNLHPHGHFLVLDGVYAAEDGERPTFYPVRAPDSKDVAAVAERVAVRVAVLLEKRDGAPALDQDEPGLAAIYGASITGRIATGPNAGQRVTTSGDFQLPDNSEERFESNGSRCAIVSGFSVHAGVSIRAGDRRGLERLCKYVARPPLAAERLAELPDGRLSYQLKTPWQNGTTHVIFDPLEFMARLAALVPVPRANLIHYYGVLAPAAKWRASIVPESPEIEAGTCCHQNDRNEKKGRPRNYAWASLMSRVFEIDVLKCPDCSGRLRILAAIHPPINTRKILDCMRLPSRAPPIARAASESTVE